MGQTYTLVMVLGGFPSGASLQQVQANRVGASAGEPGPVREQLVNIIRRYSAGSAGGGPSMSVRLSTLIDDVRAGRATKAILGPYTYAIITEPTPVPTCGAVVPGRGSADGGETVKVTGSGFLEGTRKPSVVGLPAPDYGKAAGGDLVTVTGTGFLSTDR